MGGALLQRPAARGLRHQTSSDATGAWDRRVRPLPPPAHPSGASALALLHLLLRPGLSRAAGTWYSHTSPQLLHTVHATHSRRSAAPGHWQPCLFSTHSSLSLSCFRCDYCPVLIDCSPRHETSTPCSFSLSNPASRQSPSIRHDIPHHTPWIPLPIRPPALHRAPLLRRTLTVQSVVSLIPHLFILSSSSTSPSLPPLVVAWRNVGTIRACSVPGQHGLHAQLAAAGLQQQHVWLGRRWVP